MSFQTMNRKAVRIIGIAGLAFVLAGCEDGLQLPFGQGSGTSGASDGVSPSTTTRLVERDVEAPEVFQVTDEGLWDGRPSLGGVWIAHPDATDPERVIIRNEANGEFVIGALFRRERENPGPRLQVSSDAAAALNMVAGSPTTLNVTALRREEVEEVDPNAAPAASAAVSPVDSGEIQSSTIDPIAAASAALDEVDATEATAAAPTPAAPAAVASSLDRPFIQIGIFSVEANANRSADMMRNAGLIPTVHEQTSSGRTFWRVVVGPARNRNERTTLLETIRDLGFSDAYFVTN